MQCPICGASRSRKGRPFTEATLQQHVLSHEQREQQPALELTRLIADEDMPDGAFFALAWELGEW
jgi:hypothetical protein